MNCPSRTEGLPPYDGLNQNPSDLAADLTTRQDLNGLINRRNPEECGYTPNDARNEGHIDRPHAHQKIAEEAGPLPPALRNRNSRQSPSKPESFVQSDASHYRDSTENDRLGRRGNIVTLCRLVGRILKKFGKFIGPGFLIAVAYIDPGNYSTDVAAGAATRFKLLFVVLMSNVFAIVLQSLAVRLGTVTGLDLAQHCRAHLPRWLNIALYLFGEAAIIATDIAEVRLYAQIS